MKKEYIVELREEEADELMDEHWVGELVRCKDCVHWIPGIITDKDDFIRPRCKRNCGGWSSDDYCSCAERKEG